MVDAKNLAELSNLSQQLNSQTDNLNKAIAVLNDQLAGMNLGIEVWLDSPLADSGRYTVSNPEHAYYRSQACQMIFLGYHKVKEKWQLAVREVDYVYDRSEGADAEHEIVDSEERYPLLEASRAIRVRAVDDFDDLISELKTAAETALETIQTAEKLATTE